MIEPGTKTTPNVKWGRSSWLRVSLLTAFSVVFLVSVFGSSAQAGSYTVRECFPAFEDPAHVGAPDATFSNPQGVYLGGNDCVNGTNGLLIGSQAITYSITAGATWSFSAPTGTAFSGVTFDGKLTNGNGHAPAISFYGPAFAGGYSSVPGATGYVLVPSGGFFSGVAVTPITSVVASLTCTPICAYVGASPASALRRLQFEVNDASPPATPVLSGELVAGGPRRGTETLSIDASDLGGGIRYATVSVDGAEIARPESNCAFPNANPIATQLRPCPNAHYAVPVNTEDGKWADGDHTLRVCAFDVAAPGGGQAQSTCVERSVNVDNSCEGSGGVQANQLSAGLKRGDSLVDTVEVKSTEAVPLQGVVSSGGAPVQGANICVFEQVEAPGDRREGIATLRSRSDGGFGAQLTPGPTRKIDVVYRFNNKTIEKSRLQIVSQVVPQLKPKTRRLRNGESVKFKGSIPGPHEGNRQISMQARVGTRWRTFKNVKTSHGGSFKAEYRFRTTHGRVTYIFRALVKTQAGYPYLRGASKPKKIIVTG